MQFGLVLQVLQIEAFEGVSTGTHGVCGKQTASSGPTHSI
jgi:hypothetical protein